MNKPLQKLRRFFTRTKKYHATANPDALSAAYDDDDGASRLSGAFVVVLLLHIIALVGVFAFARIKDSRSPNKTSVAEKPAGAEVEEGVKAATKTAAVGAATAPKGSSPKTSSGANSQPSAVVKESVPAAAVVHSETKTPSLEAAKPAVAKGDRVHVVKQGDNLTKIGGQYGVSVADLVKANGFKNENEMLHIGQELKLSGDGAAATAKVTPKATPEPKKPVVTEEKAPGTYIVRKNDNLSKIANSLGVKYEELVKLNNIKDPKKLQEGQKLKVPRKG